MEGRLCKDTSWNLNPLKEERKTQVRDRVVRIVQNYAH